MPQLSFSLAISPEEVQRYYRGEAHWVSAQSHDGRRVQFPAEHLRRFVTREGVRGEFLIHFDNDNRFIALERIR